MKDRKINTLTAIMSGIALFSLQASSSAAIVYAVEDFEADLGVWSIIGTGSHYTFNDATQPTTTNDGANTNNFARSGVSAARIRNGPNSLLSPSFDLSGGGANESITINMNYEYFRGQTTRSGYVELSNDNGATWMRIARHRNTDNTYVSPEFVGSVTKFEDGTISYGGSSFDGSGTSSAAMAFTNQMQVRVVFDPGNTDNDRTLYIDDLEVLASVAPVPEPSSAALLCLSGLALALRRRR